MYFQKDIDNKIKVGMDIQLTCSTESKELLSINDYNQDRRSAITDNLIFHVQVHED